MKAVCNFGQIKSPAFPSPTGNLNATYQTPYAEVSHDFHYSLGGLAMQARWGGEARLNLLQDSSITADSVPIWNVAGFASNEALIGRVRLTTGLRVDHQTLTDFTISPRVSVVFSPTPAHQLRAAFNTGYNNPSLIENLAPLLLQGNRNLLPERIYYGELAYGGTANRWLRLFANAFLYRMRNSITVAPNAAVPGTFEWANEAGVTGYGGETGFEVAPSRTISGYANYAYLHLRGDAGQPYTLAGATNLGSPVNKVTAGIRLDLPRRVYVTADGQYFGAAAVARLNDSEMPVMGMVPVYLATPISSYVMLHARTGMVFENGVDVSIAAMNLLNQTEAQLLGAQNPRLRVMATIAYYTP
jgi:outer membrane receptor protein involved in Fe transport